MDPDYCHFESHWWIPTTATLNPIGGSLPPVQGLVTALLARLPEGGLQQCLATLHADSHVARRATKEKQERQERQERDVLRSGSTGVQDGEEGSEADGSGGTAIDTVRLQSYMSGLGVGCSWMAVGWMRGCGWGGSILAYCTSHVCIWLTGMIHRFERSSDPLSDPLDHYQIPRA